MARAEFIGENVAKIELCDNFMCSCRNGLGGHVPNILTIEKPDSIADEIATMLHFSTPEGEINSIKVPGIANRFDIASAFAKEDGVVVLGDGTYVCGAIDLLLRKRING